MLVVLTIHQGSQTGDSRSQLRAHEAVCGLRSVLVAVASSKLSRRGRMSRYYLIERAQEASIFGIVVGTLGVARYRNMIRSLRAFIRSRGHHSYTFIVGKINIAKLANFAEVCGLHMVSMCTPT